MHVGRTEPRQPRTIVRPLLLSSTNLRANAVIRSNGSTRRRIQRRRCDRSVGQGAFPMFPVLSRGEERQRRYRKASQRSCCLSGHDRRT
ncbi:hypothetical protein FOWG_18235 [Fusarium oxysporum f. sp. lycopersici MN25]|nr:hypothetical protein FOWG_18235 [Fusarium oxysporum f. sp. lycopersici MN25]